MEQTLTSADATDREGRDRLASSARVYQSRGVDRRRSPDRRIIIDALNPECRSASYSPTVSKESTEPVPSMIEIGSINSRLDHPPHYHGRKGESRGVDVSFTRCVYLTR